MDFEEYKTISQRLQRDYERKHRRDVLLFKIFAVVFMLVLVLLLVSH